ncbi:MAG: hypothetical protein HYV27_03440 [Candidatus Hydrogenedentes bacterium]|nr:hypothetical protein [Candidatus Hydrogenedentota bacterium]
MDHLTLYSHAEEPAPPLHLGVINDCFGTEILALLQAVPNVRISAGTAVEIVRLHEEATFDAALLPPHEAFRFPHHPLAPGVGVFAPADYDGVCISHAMPRGTLQRVHHLPADEGLALLYAISHRAQFGALLPCVPGRPDGGLQDAALVSTPDTGCEMLHSESASVAGAWHEATGLPAPFRVWACRHRAPYSRLRQVLGSVHRTLPSAPQPLDAWEVEPVRPVAASLYYQLGSLESDALRKYHALLVEAGRCGAGTDFQYC